VIHTIEQFGWTARIVWDVLSQQGPLEFKEIRDSSHLRPYEIHIAIGWLARENKVCLQNNKYMLAETNLTPDIGTNAGVIWNILHNNGTCDINHLKKHSSLDADDIYAAIGWLAREKKINLRMKNP